MGQKNAKIKNHVNIYDTLPCLKIMILAYVIGVYVYNWIIILKFI